MLKTVTALNPQVLEKARRIKLLVLDVDGVFTADERLVVCVADDVVRDVSADSWWKPEFSKTLP